MKPPQATNKSRKQKERPPRAGGRSSAASLQHPSQNDGNNRHPDAPVPTVELPHRPRQYHQQSDENERPRLATVSRRRPCNACRRRRIKCRHARTQPQSFGEARTPSSGPESDATSDAAGTLVPALQEASDIAGDTSSSSEDGDRSISHTPFTRFKEDLSRDANPFPLILDSLSDGNDVRWTKKDGTVEIGPQLTLDPFDGDLAVDGSCLSQKDTQFNSYLPHPGSEPLSVFLSRRSIPNTLTWRLADNRTGVTMPLRRRRSRRTSARPSRSSQNNEGRQPRQSTSSAAQEVDGQVERNALPVASGPPSTHSGHQAPDLDDSRPPQGVSGRFFQPETLQVPTQFYPLTQGFGSSYTPFPAASNEVHIMSSIDGEPTDSYYNMTNPYLQQQYAQEPLHYDPRMMDAYLNNGHDQRASNALAVYGGQTQDFYNSQQQQQQYHHNVQQYTPNTVGGFRGEGQHQRASSAPMNLQDETQMVSNSPQQYPPISYHSIQNTGANFLGEGQPLGAFSPTYNHEEGQFGHNFGETPIVHDTAAAAAATQLQQFDYSNVTFPGSNNNRISPQYADTAQAPVGPYGHTMTSQTPISDTSTNLPSLNYESSSMPSDPSPEAQYARSTVSGFWPSDETPALGFGGQADVSNNGYLPPPAGSMPLSMRTSTNDAVSGSEKSPISYEEFPYEQEVEL